MTDERPQRRLAAVLAADVVGFSRLMESDEAGTLATLKSRRRNVLEPLVSQYQGRIFKVTGDGVLAEFGSAVNAVQCAIDLQQKMNGANAGLPVDRHVILRIGINLGDVMVDAGDLYGDGVNIAARLEAMAEPGGILISGTAHDYIRNKVKAAFDDLGAQALKNIADPVRAFRVREEPESPKARDLPLPDKPSIAILPLTNMSGDPAQEPFADGLTEDLITDLSRNAELFVIARNSTFAYKGRSVDVRRIAADLGVRYLLEGSVRRAADRLRINVQLIDASGGGGHLWAERFDRGVEDIFAVQDEVSAKIVEALVGRLTSPPPRNRPANLEAYDLCVRARRLLGTSAQATSEAHLLLDRAISLDPNYAEAHRWLAFANWENWANWGVPAIPANKRKTLELAQKAVEIDPNDAGCHWVLSHILAYERRWAESDAEFATAIRLDPNQADAWAIRTEVTALGGQPEAAIEQAQRALRLNPYPLAWYYWELGLAHYAARQYENAVVTLRKDIVYRTGGRRILAAALAQLGRLDEARREAALFLASTPSFTISHWLETQPIRDKAMGEHFVEGYRKAGLPE
jgi:TolB-like protein/Tfp pilus assembly protein PilF